jgi:hypothetical protein
MPAREDWRPKLTRIDDPIADDHWEYVTPEGKRRTSRLTVGRPTHYPKERVWYCPLFIEGYTPAIKPVFGEGPVDALMNAMTLVKRFVDENSGFIAGAKPKAARSSRSKTAKPKTRKPRAAKT